MTLLCFMLAPCIVFGVRHTVAGMRSDAGTLENVSDDTLRSTDQCSERTPAPNENCGSISVTSSWRPWGSVITSDCDKHYEETCFGEGDMHMCVNSPCYINAGGQCNANFIDCNGRDFQENRDFRAQQILDQRDAWMTTADRACNHPDSWPGDKHGGPKGYRAIAQKGQMCSCALTSTGLCMSCKAHETQCTTRYLAKQADRNERNRLKEVEKRRAARPVCSASSGYPKKNPRCWGPDRFGTYGECQHYCDEQCVCIQGKKCGRRAQVHESTVVFDCINS